MTQIFERHMFLLIFFCCMVVSTVVAQPDLPNRSIVVSATQTLYFGELSVISGSAGGTVIVSPNGTRSSTGQAVLINSGNMPHQAIFELKLCAGRSVLVNYISSIELIGSNGGKLILDLGPTNFGSSGSVFTSNLGCDDIHLIQVGGTLHVGPMTSNPAGVYTGSFVLTFIQQ